MNRKLIFASALALSAITAAPAPARGDCVGESIASCKGDFPGLTEQIVGIRGWCYLIRSAWCGIFDAS